VPAGLDRQPGRTLTQLIVVLLRCGHRWCSSQVSMSPSNPVRDTDYGVTVVSKNLDDFLNRLLAAVAAFAVNGSITDL
ncbi:hypothetical protein, partial [Micromonospora endophytica]|uniref:hypothetical protein n=1 Tax=Micromonospora endophytica TaxID=515350 RepID=UPI001C645422